MNRKNTTTIYAIILSFILLFVSFTSGYAYENDNLDCEDKEVYTLQLEEKTKLLIEALDEFGATSKNQAINIYAKGVKSRSGPMQYSVMCKKLKLDFAKAMAEDKNYAWVTGVSSPWVKDYRILKIKKINSNEYEATVVFLLETSSGPFGNNKTILTIKQKNNKWCITNIKEELE